MAKNVDIGALITEGKLALENEDFNEALKLFTKASKIEPNNQVILYYLALSNNSLGNFDEAVVHMKKVNEPVDDNFNFWHTIAQNYRLNREYCKAINAYKHALLCDPDEANRDVIRSIIDNLVLKAQYPCEEN